MCVVQLYNHSLVWVISAPMFEIGLIFVGVEFIVKGGAQLLSYTLCKRLLYSNYGSALRPRLHVQSLP